MALTTRTLILRDWKARLLAIPAVEVVRRRAMLVTDFEQGRTHPSLYLYTATPAKIVNDPSQLGNMGPACGDEVVLVQIHVGFITTAADDDERDEIGTEFANTIVTASVGPTGTWELANETLYTIDAMADEVINSSITPGLVTGGCAFMLQYDRKLGDDRTGA